jgi:hypothetical protein
MRTRGSLFGAGGSRRAVPGAQVQGLAAAQQVGVEVVLGGRRRIAAEGPAPARGAAPVLRRWMRRAAARGRGNLVERRTSAALSGRHDADVTMVQRSSTHIVRATPSWISASAPLFGGGGGRRSDDGEGGSDLRTTFSQPLPVQGGLRVQCPAERVTARRRPTPVAETARALQQGLRPRHTRLACAGCQDDRLLRVATA